MTIPPSQAVALSDYQTLRGSLLAELTRLESLAQSVGNTGAQAQVARLRSRLESHCFRVAVIGEFRVGKSSLINSILGESVSPVGVIPTTASVARIGYRPTRGVSVCLQDGSSRPIESADLEFWLTKWHDREQVGAVKECQVFVPSPLLLNGVELIDTPGINDEASLTDITIDILSQVDAAILVISALMPFSETTRHFLQTRVLTSDLGKVLFVVTQTDRVRGGVPAASRVIDHVTKILHQQFCQRRDAVGDSPESSQETLAKIGDPQVFGVNSVQALETRLANNSAGFAASGFRDFMTRLERLLVVERGQLALTAPLGGAHHWLREVSSYVALQQEALILPSETIAQRKAVALEHLELCERQRTERLQQFRLRRKSLRDGVCQAVAGFQQRALATAAWAIENAELPPDAIADPERQAAAVRELTAAAEAALRTEVERRAGQVQTLWAAECTAANRELSTFQWSLDSLLPVGRSSEHATRPGTTDTESGESLVNESKIHELLSSEDRSSRRRQIGASSLGAAATLVGGAMGMVALHVAVTPPIAMGLIAVGWWAGRHVVRFVNEPRSLSVLRSQFARQWLRQWEGRDLEAELTEAFVKSADDALTNWEAEFLAQSNAALADCRHALTQSEIDARCDETVREERQVQLSQIASQLLELSQRLVLLQQRCEALAAQSDSSYDDSPTASVNVSSSRVSESAS
jgi:predicted GTPase